MEELNFKLEIFEGPLDLMLNLSNKEISQMLNIEARSVEMKRYRLRKKLGLGPGDDIEAFLARFYDPK